MIEEVLANFAYVFYPKNVCPWDERDKYLETIEYKRLKKIIDSFDSEENLKIRDNIRKEFENDIILKEFQDFSTLENFQDRCFTFFLNVFENGELLSITLHISFLLPYYVIRRGWHHAEPWFTKEKIIELESQNLDSRNREDLILDIEKIVEEKLSYQKFPQTVMHTIIKDIGFQGISLGDFKMYNAFFNDQNIYMKILTRNFLIFLTISISSIIYFYFDMHLYVYAYYDTYYCISYFYFALLFLIFGSLIYFFRFLQLRKRSGRR